jgi:hypothetical protein
MDISLWEHLKMHVYAVPTRTLGDVLARTQAFVTMVDANMLRRVKQNAIRRIAVFLETDGGLFVNPQ